MLYSNLAKLNYYKIFPHSDCTNYVNIEWWPWFKTQIHNKGEKES